MVNRILLSLPFRSAILCLVTVMLVSCAGSGVVDGYERLSTFTGSVLVPATSAFDFPTRRAAAAALIAAEERIFGEEFEVTAIERVNLRHEKWSVERIDDSALTYEVRTDGEFVEVIWTYPENPELQGRVEVEI